MPSFLKAVFIAGFFLSAASTTFAADPISTKPAVKKSSGYIDALMHEILRRTDGPGAAPLNIPEPPEFSRDRKLVELIAGNNIEYDAIGTKPEWEKELLTIRIPLRKGLQGYRLFLINESSKAALSAISSLEDLQQFPTGSGAQWSTTPNLEHAGFDVVKGESKSGLMKMLAANRFTTFGRGVDEIFYEYENAKSSYPNLAIDQTVALYIPHPTYIFVTPKRPDLAKRFETGLEEMIEDGSFDRLFWKFFDEDIQKANLAARKIFHIDNPRLNAATPFEKSNLWFHPGTQAPSEATDPMN